MYASTACRHSWSIISIAAGTIPAAITALTVDAPASTESKSISIVHMAGGSGVSFTHTLVVTPSIPSLPTNVPRRSNPSGSGSSPPRIVTVPSGSTTSRAMMWALVTPSARQCGPPELLATLPPIEHVCWLLGSGAKCRPWTATARDRSRLSIPGSTHARRPIGSTARSRFIFVVAITIAPSGGTAPPARPVPDPRATNGTPWRAAMRHARLDLVRRRREADGDGRAGHVRGVVAVQRQLGRAGVDPVGFQRGRAARSRSAGPERRDRERRRSFTSSAPRGGASGSPAPIRPAPRRRAPRRRAAGGRARRTSLPSRSARSSRSRTRRGVTALANGIGEPPSRGTGAAGRPAGHVGGRHRLRRGLVDLALGVARPDDPGGDPTGEPHHGRTVTPPGAAGARRATCRSRCRPP